MKRIIILALFGALLLAAVPYVSAQAQSVKAGMPILITSCGQSPGPVMMKVILQKALGQNTTLNIDNKNTVSVQQSGPYELIPLATPSDLKLKPFKSLIIVMGASLKGMGAAGISIDDELKRVGALIDEAKKLKITVIGAHIEGLKRRAQGADAGDTTDEQSIDAVAPKSDILLVNKDGDGDGRFTNIAKAKNIPIILVEKNLDLLKECEKLFK
jgi:hypothetical protein